MKGRLMLALWGIGAVAVVAAGVGAYASVRSIAGGESRQEIVASRGAMVMPFDLDKTTHVFTKTGDGGIETITIDDPADADQIPLIRSHLAKEAAAFARGDFSDPVAIHGAGMPGVAQLEAAGERLIVEYGELPDGARLVYVSEDASIVDALHRWFDAQLADHGAHARQ